MWSIAGTRPAIPDRSVIAMKNDDKQRSRAEDFLAGRAERGADDAGTPADARTSQRSAEHLLHELQVHQIELQMQNEELVEARDELAASLERYTDLYDFAPLGYFTVAPSGAVLKVNIAGAALLGREIEEVRGADVRSFVAAESLPSFNIFFAQVLTSAAKHSCELALRGAAGTISAHVEALADARKGECRLAVVDITEHKRGLAIRESEQRFQVALANSPITVFEQDLDLRYTWIHNAMWGLCAGQVIGRRNSDLMEGASAGWLDALLREVIASGHSKRAEVSIAGTGEERICWDISIHPRFKPSGEVSGVIGAATDVTERKHFESALRTAKEEAERADNAKSRFLAAASHDLRQPLGALALYVDVLKGKVISDDALLVDRIKGCVTSMSALLNDLLDVSKLTAGVVRPQLSNFSIDEMLSRLVAVHAPEAQLKGLRLRLRRCQLTAYTDPVWFNRMIGNLIANAVDYTQHGGALVACRRHAGRMWVEIRDTGIGIPGDQTSAIFEEFRQLGGTSRTRGSGLGLAIVARAAALLGLEIRVRSIVGRGSLFAVELPLPPADSTPAVPPEKHEAHAGKALRIALVEDNPAVLQALCYVLKSSGHRVVAATSRVGLIRNLSGIVPDLVISDYRLPDNETGLDVISTVRRTFGKALPAIIITGDTDPAIMAEMSRHGILIQHKPIDAETLEMCITQAMR